MVLWGVVVVEEGGAHLGEFWGGILYFFFFEKSGRCKKEFRYKL